LPREGTLPGLGLSGARALVSQLVPIDSLTRFPDNPRRGDVDAIAASLRAFGQTRPIIVQRSSGYIVGGNHVWAAAKTLGWEEINAIYLDLDDIEAKRVLLADNQLSARGQTDPEALHRWLADLYDKDALDSALGWDPDELDRILKRRPQTDPNVVPTVSSDSWVEDGMVIALGRHRVICGDAADPETLTALLGDALVDCIWTDPPYGVDYQGVGRGHVWGHPKRDAIEGDSRDLEALEAMLSETLGLAFARLRPGRAIYVHANPGAGLATFINVAVRLGFYRATLAWVKDTFVLARNDFHPRWEPIIYGWKPGTRHFWAGDRAQDTVWEFPRPRQSDVHPTMKPVELGERVLTLSTRKGEVVLDTFAGSGTVVIAAERTGRTAYAAEILPAYVQVICERWAEMTGIAPVIVSRKEPSDAPPPTPAPAS
jgi:DNA modification methylase